MFHIKKGEIMKQKILLGLSVMTLFVFSSCTAPNKEEPPAQTTSDNLTKFDSGLQYEVLQPGTGAKPKTGQRVTVHYTGWLQDNTKADGKGKKFDSSVDRGNKFSFTIGVGQVIKGWDEGVLDMKIGEKRKLVIPHQLAYGEYGHPGIIPPRATLIFEVELFDAK